MSISLDKTVIFVSCPSNFMVCKNHIMILPMAILAELWKRPKCKNLVLTRPSKIFAWISVIKIG